MRIPSSKPPVVDQPKVRDNTRTESVARPESGEAPRPSEAAVPSPGLDRTVIDAETAARELDQTIAARLEQVREQLLGGNYAIDYERLAQRLAEEGLGS